MSRAPFTAALIAGGKSSRMGADKRFLDIGGKPLWQHQLETLQKLDPAELLISAEANAAWPPGVRIVEDPLPDQGPLGALHAVLSAASCDRVLVLAVDLPMMTAAFLTTFLDETASIGVVPQRADFFEPLAAVYPRKCAGLVAESLRSGDLSLQSFVRKGMATRLIKSLKIDDGQVPLFSNINTPEDLNALRCEQGLASRLIAKK